VGQVSVRVNGYGHTIGCKDGEEDHVLRLVQQIEDKIRVIRSMGGQFSESRMLLHVALLLADESSDLREELSRMRADAGTAPLAAAPSSPPAGDPALAQRLHRVAERIEMLADTLRHG
jgi:cell division protein ZapA